MQWLFCEDAGHSRSTEIVPEQQGGPMYDRVLLQEWGSPAGGLGSTFLNKTKQDTALCESGMEVFLCADVC